MQSGDTYFRYTGNPVEFWFQKTKEPHAGLRLALTLGFGGMLLIFLIAGVDSIDLLRQMRADNKILRDASLERSRRLASIRSYVLISRSYIHENQVDIDALTADGGMEALQNACTRALDNLAGYRTSTLEEVVRLRSLHDLLQQHWRQVEESVTHPSPESSRQILSLQTAILEINTRADDVDARQLASTENEIQRQFENLGKRLSLVLIIALAAALLLAAGCIAYILRIERQNRRRFEEIVKGRRELEQLSARLVDAQETERRAISRELHDEVGQTLGAVLVDAANLSVRVPPEDTTSHRYLDNIRGLVDSSINSIRNISLLLRPSMLDDLGLIPALEWQAREVSRRSKVNVKVTAEGVSDSLPDADRTGVYRIVQEALHNVSRHAGAKNVQVTVKQSDGSLELTVKDDGSGFNPETTRGLGLLGMVERVKQLAGQMEIQSQPGKGTVLRVTLPVTAGATG